jgi:putative transposase
MAWCSSTVASTNRSGRERFEVARCTVQRLMKRLGLEGVVRGKPVRTTVSDPKAACPLDHVNRQFHADSRMRSG